MRHEIPVDKYDRALKPISPQRGDRVAVCYDGKWGRAVVGEVLQRRGFALRVRFRPNSERKVFSPWFVRKSPRNFGAFVRDVDFSIMRSFLGLPGDWYSVMHLDVYKALHTRDELREELRRQAVPAKGPARKQRGKRR